VGLNERIVDGDDVNIVMLNSIAEDDTSNAAETVDTNLNGCHVVAGRWLDKVTVIFLLGEFWWGSSSNSFNQENEARRLYEEVSWKEELVKILT
jgi:hypothetical protein